MIGRETERGISRAGAREGAGWKPAVQGTRKSSLAGFPTLPRNKERGNDRRPTSNWQQPWQEGLFAGTKGKGEHYETNAARRLCSHLAQSRDLDLPCSAESKSRGAECRASATCSRA